MDPQWPEPLDASYLQALFDDSRPLTIGLEEELMVLDPETLDLFPQAGRLIEGEELDERFKTELPASHLEIATHVAQGLGGLGRQLWDGRQELARHIGAKARLAAAGVHPFASTEGMLNETPMYRHTCMEFGMVARQQLVCGLHVHVRLSGAERVLAVYNELRAYLPELAALAANAPIYAGRDSGMASMRPIISGLLPRQGVPPPFLSWHEFADELRWGRRGQRLTRPGEWWWELRPHVQLGTLEVRVPDAQMTVSDAMAVTSIVSALALWVARCHDASGLPSPVPSWRINENRWSAARYGLEGQMVDLRTGRPQPTRERIHNLIEELEPVVQELGGSSYVAGARALVECNGAERQRRIMAEAGPHALTGWLADQFLHPDPNR